MQYNNLEILQTRWYNRLGIIKTKDITTNEIKIFIGEGYGFDEQQDIKHIIDWGTKYTIDSFKELTSWLEADK